MANYRKDSSEEEALFRSYPYTLYFVQSPSTISHANTTLHNYTNSPDINNNNFINIPTTPQSPDHQPPAHRALSSSSSRGSDNSFFDYMKKYYYSIDLDGGDRSRGVVPENSGQNGGVMKHYVEDEEEEEEDDGIRSGWVRYFSFGYSDSGWWILVQLSWRFLLSFIIVLFVFYVATKPPPPKVSVKIGGIEEFRLGEGVDGSGVSTKILTCNCSIHLTIDNDSKLFALHINPPILQLLFAHLPFATSQVQGKELIAGSDDTTLFRLNVGTKNKAMYGAGRNMQDLLQSGAGLPWVIKVGITSSFHVVWGLFESKFHHEAHCLVVLSNKYDKKHRTQVYKSTCTIH